MKRPKPGWEMLCEHANEMPRICPCPLTCGCRYYACKPAPIEKDESGLKSKLLTEIRLTIPGFIPLRHEDVRTAGIPDLSLTGCGRTSWWEFKHATPNFESTGIQELTMLRLASSGFARYVIWFENKEGNTKRTLIVHPRHLKDLLADAWCVEFDHRFVVDYMKKAHGL